MGMDDYLAENGSNTGEFGSEHRGRAKKGFDKTDPLNEDLEDSVDEMPVPKKKDRTRTEHENPRHDLENK